MADIYKGVSIGLQSREISITRSQKITHIFFPINLKKKDIGWDDGILIGTALKKKIVFFSPLSRLSNCRTKKIHVSSKVTCCLGSCLFCRQTKSACKVKRMGSGYSCTGKKIISLSFLTYLLQIEKWIFSASLRSPYDKPRSPPQFSLFLSISYG